MKIMRVIATVILLLAPIASYGGFRCGNRLVSVGDTKGDIQLRCGKPDLITREAIKDATPGQRGKSRVMETWTYNMGDRRLVKILRFQGSRLVRTEDGGYGTGPRRHVK